MWLFLKHQKYTGNADGLGLTLVATMMKRPAYQAQLRVVAVQEVRNNAAFFIHVRLAYAEKDVCLLDCTKLERLGMYTCL
jgi:hypothetical protein